MHEMRDIGDRLQRDFRAVESAASCGRTGGELLRAALLALLAGFRQVLVAGRLLEHLQQLF